MLNRFGAAVPAFVAASAIACALLGWTNLPAASFSAAAQRVPATTASDLSGVWITASGVFDYAAFSEEAPPMTAAGRAQYEAARPSQGPRGVKLEETNDRVYKCSPPGVPYIYIQIFPMQIIQTPREVIEFFEYDHTVRYIYT